MYPEFKRINAFIGEAANLLKTSKTMKDIFESIFTRNKRNKCATYFNEKGKLKSYRYSKMEANAKAFAGIICKKLANVEKHQPIVLKVANNPHWGECFWAILMSGFKPLLVDAKTSVEGTTNLIKQGHAIAVLTDDMFHYETTKISFDELVESTEAPAFEPVWENEVFFCSSGTTGDVKLMIFNGENLCNQIAAALDMPKETKDIVYPRKYGKIRILAMIPFHHIFGFVAVFLWYTYYGAELLYPASQAPSELQKMCQQGKATHIYSVPLLWDSLAQTLNRKLALAGEEKQKLLEKMVAYNTGKISKKEAGLAGKDIAKHTVQKMLFGKYARYCISGGGYLCKETLETINGVGYPLYNGYGMTEIGVTSVELSSNVLDRLKGSIGHPLHNVEYKIATGNGDGQPNELLIKSPTVHVREIIGGVEQPASIDENGYFHSGDIAGVDEQGGYYIRGRIKDIIINADGENVFPDELEIFFKDLPHVSHLCVLGEQVEPQKEDIVLVLELDNSVNDEQLQEIRDRVKEISKNLPKKAVIASTYLAKAKLPLANNMKVKRFAIKKAIEAKTGEYVSIDVKKENKSFEGFDQETIEKVLIPMRNIFSKILILPAFKIEDDGHWINDLGGDSMSYVELLNEVQNTFNVTIPEELYGELKCVNDFVLEVVKLQKQNQK